MKKKHSYFIDYVKMSIKLTKRSMILTEIIMKCFQRATNAAEDASDEGWLDHDFCLSYTNGVQICSCIPGNAMFMPYNTN